MAEPLITQLPDVFDLEAWSEAVGLLVEFRDPVNGRSQFIGPFAKDGLEARALIERLRSEETLTAAGLFPQSSTKSSCFLTPSDFAVEARSHRPRLGPSRPGGGRRYVDPSGAQETVTIQLAPGPPQQAIELASPSNALEALRDRNAEQLWSAPPDGLATHARRNSHQRLRG